MTSLTDAIRESAKEQIDLILSCPHQNQDLISALETLNPFPFTSDQEDCAQLKRDINRVSGEEGRPILMVNFIWHTFAILKHFIFLIESCD